MREARETEPSIPNWDASGLAENRFKRIWRLETEVYLVLVLRSNSLISKLISLLC